MRITEDNRIVYVSADFSEIERYLRAAEDLHMKYTLTNEDMEVLNARSLYPNLMRPRGWPPYEVLVTVYKLLTDVGPLT